MTEYTCASAAHAAAEAAWRNASPVAHVGKSAMPPFLFAYVERPSDSKEKKVEPSEHLAQLIRDAKGTAEVRLLTDRTHFMANHLIGAPADKTGQILLDFVRKVTR
jgi:hypothetical protein